MMAVVPATIRAIVQPPLLLAILLPLAGCQTDPTCHARNAPAFIPSSERYRTMTPAERRAEAARFDALARRCGWEP